MPRHLQNWIQSILIGKSDFLGQGPHHPNNIVSVVFGNRPLDSSYELFTILGTPVSFIDQELQDGPEPFNRTNLWGIWKVLVLWHKRESLVFHPLLIFVSIVTSCKWQKIMLFAKIIFFTKLNIFRAIIDLEKCIIRPSIENHLSFPQSTLNLTYN